MYLVYEVHSAVLPEAAGVCGRNNCSTMQREDCGQVQLSAAWLKCWNEVTRVELLLSKVAYPRQEGGIAASQKRGLVKTETCIGNGDAAVLLVFEAVGVNSVGVEDVLGLRSILSCVAGGCRCLR
jgi:hypothetical protein